jgi:SPASM domain peptide maturase of grasp-with-spasm system
LCVDENGYIKNCPSMEKHYGHIDDIKLEDVVKSDEFQKLWHIKKDDIKVCQDCEFRHMCMDCRAFIKDPNDIYSQPAKCHYNPYIAKWKGQEGFISVEEYKEKQKVKP